MGLFVEEKQHNSKEAPKNGKTLLVDADTVCFHSILQCTAEEILMDRDFYSDEAWEKLSQEEGFNEHTMTCRHLNFDQAKKAFDYKIESLLMATGCEKAEIYLTGWLPTFRHYILPEYKSDRKGGQRPLRLAEFKLWLVKEREAMLSPAGEADEEVVSEYLKRPNDTMIASVDKDLLTQVAGPKFDYYSKRFHAIEVTEHQAAYNFHKRLLTGDRGDYILTGLTRVGDKTADKLLKPMEKFADLHIMDYKVELYKLVRKEYIRQRVDRLHLMWATIGADYLVNGKIVIPEPPMITDRCCYCSAKTDDIDCGNHEMPDYPTTFDPFGGGEDTHLMTGIGAKKKRLFYLYKEWMGKKNLLNTKLEDMGFFYSFVSAMFKDLDDVTVDQIETKYKEL